jgi:GxxExxY protein
MEQEDRKIGRFEDGTELVIGAFIEVHRTSGPGLLESAYEACVCAELSIRGMRVAPQPLLPVEYVSCSNALRT